MRSFQLEGATNFCFWPDLRRRPFRAKDRPWRHGERSNLYSPLVQRDHDVGLRSAAHDVIDRMQRLAGIACGC